MEKDIAKSLTGSVLFEGMGEKDIKKVLACLDPIKKSYEKNELITRQGESFSRIGVVLSGRANVFREKASGLRLVMENIGPGDLFGEIAAFAGGDKWPATVQSMERSEIIFISKEKVLSGCGHACSWHQKLTGNFLAIISARAMMLSNKIEYLTIKSMRGKIAAFLYDQYSLKNNSDFDIGMNRNEMADFLNVSRPSLSRELKRMKEEEIIDFHLSQFKILDTKKLREND